MDILRRRAPKLVALGCGIVAFSFLLGPRTPAAQESHKPLAEKDVINLLTNDVAPQRVGELARQFGVSFQMTAPAEKALRDAGATDSLIQTLRSLGPKAASPPPQANPAPRSSPPLLLIVSSPGDADVYIDDEPMGTTSPEGRLKLSKLGPGEHRVRVAHGGYQDFEQSVQLDSGTVTVAAELQSQTAANTASAPQASQQTAGQAQPSSTGPGVQAGVLGMFFRTSNVGGRVGEITALVPGGPAEHAGIRPGYTLVSINGQSVATTQEAQQVFAGHPPGDTVQATFYDGSGKRTVPVTLASPSIFQTVPHFHVMHDHGPPAPNYCVGWMWVFDGMITYVGQNAVAPNGQSGLTHRYEFPMREIREVRKNGFYMAAIGAFHIRMRNGNVANFILLNQQGRYTSPDPVLSTVQRMMTGY